MKALTNIVLLLITVGLAIASLARLDDAPIALFKATETFEIGEKAFPSDIFALRRIKIKYPNGPTLDMHGSGQQWQTSEPWQDRADYHTRVEPLLHFLHNSKIVDVLPRKGTDVENLGLRGGAFEFQLYDAESNTLEHFRLGRISPWHSIAEDEDKTKLPTYFIRHKQSSRKDSIYLVTDTSLQLHELFENHFQKFRDHRPLAIYESIEQIRLMRKGTDMVMQRAAIGKPWFITKPLELRCDQVAVKQLITDLSLLTATEVEDSQNFPESLNPDETLEVGIKHFQQDEEITLSIALPKENTEELALAKVSNRSPVFSLPVNPAAEIEVSLSKLPLTINDIRAKNMLALNGQQLKTVVIRPANQQPILLDRQRGSPYQLLLPNGATDLEIETLTEFFTALTVDKVIKFASDAAVDLRPYGLDQPFLQIALVDFGQNQQRLQISRSPDDSLIYAKMAHLPIVWQISEDTLQKLDRPLWEWKPKRLWNLPTIDITSINLRKKGSPLTYITYNFNTDTYSAIQGQNDLTDQLNQNRARYYFESISKLSAFRRLGPTHMKAKELLQDPDFTLTVVVQEYDDEGEPSYEIDHWLKLSRASKAANNQFYYVSISGEPDYFLLNAETAGTLATDLFTN